MTDREIAERIAHDVAVESGMAHESLSALTAVIQEGIDRALAAASLSAGEDDDSYERGWHGGYQAGADNTLAREAKAREEERERIFNELYERGYGNLVEELSST